MVQKVVAFMYVDLSRFPDPNKQRVVDFPSLDGGWNINVRSYKLPQNESPSMKNLWWQDGMLRCRDGQNEVPTQTPADEPDLTGQTYAVYDGTFYGFGFAHIGRTVYYFDPSAETVTYHPMIQKVNPTGGTFFRYGDDLFYKTGAWFETINVGENDEQQVIHHGGYYRIHYMPEDKLRFVMSDASKEAFVPTILLNADPRTCAGDRYQPENRLSSMKRVRYSPVIYNEEQDFTGYNTNGSPAKFPLKKKDTVPDGALAYYIKEVYVDGERTAQYELEHNGSDKATVCFEANHAPAAGAKILVKYQYCDYSYAVPVTGSNETNYTISVSVIGDGETREFLSKSLAELSDGYFQPAGLLWERLRVIKVFLGGVWVPDEDYTSDIVAHNEDSLWDRVRFEKAPANDTEVKFYISVYQQYYAMAAKQVVVSGTEYAPQSQKVKPFPSVARQKEYQLEKDEDGQYPIVAKAAFSPQPDSEPTVTYDRVTGIMQLSHALDAGFTIQPEPAGTFDMEQDGGTVLLSPSPSVLDAATPNSVEITLDAPNPDAHNAVMDCCYATTNGGQNSLCILLGGCPSQPNAVFWNSNDNLSINPAYFPLDYYNLVGDTEDVVTGFGRQYNDLIVFKEHSLCKMEFSTQTVDGRTAVSFTYKPVNAHIGCDLPGTIQLIENNLVFCNTYAGVHILLSSSAAYENNVARISLKVNGDPERDTQGILHDVRRAGVSVTSFDDDRRYWLLAGDHAYLWDYEISGYKNPSWFYLDGLRGVSYFRDPAHNLYHIGDWGSKLGRLTKFTSSFSDYGRPISKHYEFPTQLLGSVSRLKDVTKAVFSFGVDAESDIKLTYLTNLERREDLTGIHVPAPSEGVLPGPHIVIRRPMCRHIRAFSMRLENNDAGQDLAIVSAQIQYTLQDMDR